MRTALAARKMTAPIAQLASSRAPPSPSFPITKGAWERIAKSANVAITMARVKGPCNRPVGKAKSKYTKTTQ